MNTDQRPNNDSLITLSSGDVLSDYNDKLRVLGVKKLSFLQISSLDKSGEVVGYDIRTASLQSHAILTRSQSNDLIQLFTDSLHKSQSSITLFEKRVDKILSLFSAEKVTPDLKENLYLTRHYGPSLTVCYSLFTVAQNIEMDLEIYKAKCYMLVDAMQHKFFNEKAQKYIASKKISPREKQVLSLLVLGKTSNDIATELNISPYTVSSYINVLGLKLEEKSRLKIALKALRLGIFDNEIAYSEK